MQQPRRTLQSQRYVCVIDESRRGAAYLLAAVTMSVADRQRNRDAATQCLLPGERSWHMSKERPSRRRQALTAMAQLPVTVTIYQSRITVERDEEEVRGRCLRALVEDILLLGSCQLIIESRDEHLESQRPPNCAGAPHGTRCGGHVRTHSARG